MIEGRPSRTALGAAMRRAAHQLLDRPLVFEDPLAIPILPPEAVDRIRREAAGSRTLRSSPRLRAFLAARSRLTEDWLAHEVAAGVTQYVLLGAGFDTFAYRSHERFPSLRVFEVDHPATQGWKRRRLVDAGIAVPASVTYVPVDFAVDDFLERLVAAGFDLARPACFAWLGVTMYLTADDVMTTLRRIASCAAGSSVVFDYMIPREQLSWLARLYVWRSERRVARQGEPWISRFDPPALATALRGLGFTTLDDHGPDAIHTRYFAGRSDGFRTGRGGRIMVAGVS